MSKAQTKPVYIDECFPTVEDGSRFVTYYSCDCGHFRAVSHEPGDRVDTKGCTCNFQTMFAYNIPDWPMVVTDERLFKAPVSQV